MNGRAGYLAYSVVLFAIVACGDRAIAAGQGRAVMDAGERALSAGDLNAAANAYARAATDPSVAGVAAYDLGLVRVRQGRVAEAVTAFTRAIALATSPAVRARAYYNLGTLIGSSGQFDDAIRALTEALRLDPASEDARVNLAILKARQAAQRSPPPPKDGSDDRSLREVPAPSYAFTRGQPRQAPAGIQHDW